MIQFAILIGALGCYNFFVIEGVSKRIAFIGGLFYSMAALMPITGQLVFVYSFAALPYILIASKWSSNNFSRDKKILAKFLVLITGIPLLMASGYVWLNIVNMGVGFIYGLNSFKKNNIIDESLIKKYLNYH
jgi:hypothetical protein